LTAVPFSKLQKLFKVFLKIFFFRTKKSNFW